MLALTLQGNGNEKALDSSLAVNCYKQLQPLGGDKSLKEASEFTN